jgi:hypothetical protein
MANLSKILRLFKQVTVTHLSNSLGHIPTRMNNKFNNKAYLKEEKEKWTSLKP